MSGGAATTYLSARLLAPDMLERGVDQLIRCPVYQEGALVAPSVGTVSVFDGSGTAVVDAQAVTITGSIAQYTVTAATTTSLSLSESWRVEWSLTITGDVHVFRNDAALVRRALYPVVADADLFRRVSALDPASSACIHSLSTLQNYRDEAYSILVLRLLARGNRPNLVMSPSSLRTVHMSLSLSLIFADFSTRLSEAYGEHAAQYRHEFEQAWSLLSFLYDADDSGAADDTTGRRAAQPTVWTNGRA